MNSTRLMQLSSYGEYHDAFYFTEDEARLYPAFGREKVLRQSRLWQSHRGESAARMAKAMRAFADLNAKPAKEADWAIMGGRAQGIGGVDAGISAAAQTQVNNMGVRQRNAQRAAESAAIHAAANNVGSIYGQTDEAFIVTDAEADQLAFLTTTSTEELFSKLSFTMTAEHPDRLNNCTKLQSNDHHESHISFTVRIASTHDRRIDGYVLISLMTKRGKIRYEKILPLPLLGVGEEKETAAIRLRIPGGLRCASFRPLALWEVTPAKAGSTSPIQQLSDLPASEMLAADWTKNLQLHEATLNKLKIQKRNRVLIRSILIAAAVMLAVLAGFLTYWQVTFSFGVDWINGYPGRADRDYFSRLPAFYHEQIADAYIEHTEGYMSILHPNTSVLEKLSCAEKYMQTEEQRQKIIDLTVQAYTYANSGAPARSYIEYQYKFGHLSAAQVTEYAEMMYSFVHEYKNAYERRSERNELQDDALYLVDLVKAENSRAARLSDEWHDEAQANSDTVQRAE